MIKLEHLTKCYRSLTAISNISLNMDQPGIYCLLGKNGAGKTTLLKLISGHITPTDGKVSVGNVLVDTYRMPESLHFIQSDASQFNMRIKDLLKAASELNSNFEYEYSCELMRKFKLDPGKRYNKLSFGMKVMTNTILGLASDKQVIILDEPVLGFDAIMRKAFYEMLQESCMEKQKYVIISTHLIDEIAKIVNYLIIIEKGELLLYTDINSIDEKAYMVTGPAALVEEVTKDLNCIGTVTTGGFITKYIYDSRIKDSNQYTLASVRLQDFFVNLVGNDE